MIRILASEGIIPFREHDQTTAAVKPDVYIPGAAAFEADQPAGQFFYETYVHKHYTIFKSILIPARDLTLRVEYLTSFLGFRIMVKNHMRYKLNEKVFYLMQGQVNFVSAPRVVSELHLAKGQVYQMFDLQIAPVFLERFRTRLLDFRRLTGSKELDGTEVLLNGPGFASARVLDLMEDLVAEPANEDLAVELIEQVIEARTGNRVARAVTERQVESLFRVKAQIKERISLKQHLRDWARAAGMNITYFKEMFKAVFAVTPYHYLLYERIREAKRLMKFNPQLRLSEVAAACGFTNYNNLRRAFVAIENITLAQWQRLSNLTGVILVMDFLT